MALGSGFWGVHINGINHKVSMERTHGVRLRQNDKTHVYHLPNPLISGERKPANAKSLP